MGFQARGGSWLWEDIHSLTDHVVGDVDLDLSLVLEGHLALDALVRLLLFGNEKNQVSRDRKPGLQKPGSRRCPSVACPLPGIPIRSLPPPSDPTSPGHRLPSKGLLSCRNWNNLAVTQSPLPQEPMGFAPLTKANPCIHLTKCKCPAVPVLAMMTPRHLLNERCVLPTGEIWESAWILRAAGLVGGVTP